MSSHSIKFHHNQFSTYRVILMSNQLINKWIKVVRVSLWRSVTRDHNVSQLWRSGMDEGNLGDTSLMSGRVRISPSWQEAERNWDIHACMQYIYLYWGVLFRKTHMGKLRSRSEFRLIFSPAYFVTFSAAISSHITHINAADVIYFFRQAWKTRRDASDEWFHQK